MRSRIFSSKYLKTISKGQLWMPAFIALGFFLAFPVTGMVKLSSWSDLQYSALQNQILYNNLWKDGFVLSGMIISSIAAFINSVNGFIYTVEQLEFFLTEAGFSEITIDHKNKKHHICILAKKQTIIMGFR